jgi:predicted nucleic acid-binding protein
MAVSNKVFLDTNVVLDFLDAKRQGHQDAVELMQYLLLNDYEIVISEDMISTIFYIDKQHKRVLAFFQTILDKWHIVPFGLSVIREAVTLSLEKQLDLEDVLQALSAKEHGCYTLVTNDKKFYQETVRTETVVSFLSTVQS